MLDIAIIVIAYNRHDSLERLLKSIGNGYYENDKIDLIISIDKGGSKKVIEVAESFKWEYGVKKIMVQTENLGLRKHILKCGDVVEKYDGIIMLEDDLYVAKDFYNYAEQALEFYEKDENIGGISLYSNEWSQSSNRPFQPIDNGSDIFFIQLAQSWGQIWSKKMWRGFREWYVINQQNEFKSSNVPNNISNWPETSWLKYNIKYLIEENKFFVFPRLALSTNFNNPGQHVKQQNAHYQVNLTHTVNKKYTFKKFDEVVFKYDAFYELIGLEQVLGVPQGELCVDLYGAKKNDKKFLLTMENYNYRIEKSFALLLRPHELNIIWNIQGNDIFLYNTNKKQAQNIKKYNAREKQILYDVRNLSFIDASLIIVNKIKRKLKEKIRKTSCKGGKR